MTGQDAAAATAVTPAGREVTGPTSMGTDPKRFWHLAWTLATTEFKLRFFGSVLGYFWQLMRPLLLFAVLYAVFVGILNTGGDQPMFGVALLLGGDPSLLRSTSNLQLWAQPDPGLHLPVCRWRLGFSPMARAPAGVGDADRLRNRTLAAALRTVCELSRR